MIKQLHSLIWFFQYFLIVFVIAISESLSRVIIKDVVQGYFRRFILDFLASMEACMLAWEIITVFQVYGIASFGVLLYCNLLAKAYRYHIWKGISCPYTLIQSYVFRARYKVSQHQMLVVNVMSFSFQFWLFLFQNTASNKWTIHNTLYSPQHRNTYT